MIVKHAALTALVVVAGSCVSGDLVPTDTGLEGLTLSRVDPGVLLPGTTFVATGRSFVDDSLGKTQVRYKGTLDGRAIDFVVPARYVSGSRLELTIDDTFYQGTGGAKSGTLDVIVQIEVKSSVDGEIHSDPGIHTTFALAPELAPSILSVGDGLSFVNQPTEVTGDGFLLGGTEGETHAILSGCFRPAGAMECSPIAVADIVARPTQTFGRRSIVFPYASSVSGIGPGDFEGELRLQNVHGDGSVVESPPRAVTFNIQKPTILSAMPTAASLGQYVVISGGGFVGGGEGGEVTVIDLVGQFTPDDPEAEPRPLDIELVPAFVAGPTVRYVLDESDSLGQVVMLRRESGTITGTAKPIVQKGVEFVEGDAIPVMLRVEPVKQVVFIDFLPSYVSNLRQYGLRAIDHLIRARTLEVARRDYAGINVDFRDTLPDDFALYSQVDIAGADPNGLGLFGYDNSPGKDTDNLRLYDRIGGVNAITQQNGDAGYGGVFTESFFGFSEHPAGYAEKLSLSDPLFDQIFDPFRPDRGGTELTAAELSRLSPEKLSEGSQCPAPSSARGLQISCAVWVLGNLIGTTMTHEVGHSLGLANPYGTGFHDFGDEPNRLMDSGGARTFNERAELLGEGPSVFCDEEYDYLRVILPSKDPAPAVDRPVCN